MSSDTLFSSKTLAGWEQLRVQIPPESMRLGRLLAAHRSTRLAWIIRPLVIELIEREYARTGPGDSVPRAPKPRPDVRLGRPPKPGPVEATRAGKFREAKEGTPAPLGARSPAKT